MPRGGPTPAARALDQAGMPYALHAFEPSDLTGLSYGGAAAEALGVGTERVFKTLVTVLAPGPGPAVVAVVPVGARLDLRALAAALGAKRASLAEPAVAERLTGYVLGGISPFGQRRALPTVVDRSAAAVPTVFVSGGRRGLELEVAPDDLVAVTAASWADLAG